MEKLQLWIKSMRFFSLPLVTSAVFLGAACAKVEGAFSLPIFLLLFITGSLLQILSNLANDYGDATNGADGENRSSPKGAVSRGKISQKEMLYAVIITAGLSFIFALLLIYVSFGTALWAWITFVILTIITIIAAIRYTMGKNPYGYRAKGDLSVFIFFGLVAVAGSYCFFNAPLYKIPGLPACAAGLFTTAVLNANNIRDMKSDRIYGKDTIALRLGEDFSRYYQLTLIGGGILCWAIYFMLLYPTIYLLLLVFTAPLVYSAYKVYTSYDVITLDKQVKLTAKATGLYQFIVSLVFFFQ